MHQDKVYVYLYACASICNLCFAGKRKSDQGHHVTVYLPVSECNKGFQAVHVHVGLPESRNYHLLFFFSSLYRVLYVYNCKKAVWSLSQDPSMATIRLMDANSTLSCIQTHTNPGSRRLSPTILQGTDQPPPKARGTEALCPIKGLP